MLIQIGNDRRRALHNILTTPDQRHTTTRCHLLDFSQVQTRQVIFHLIGQPFVIQRPAHFFTVMGNRELVENDCHDCLAGMSGHCRCRPLEHGQHRQARIRPSRRNSRNCCTARRHIPLIDYEETVGLLIIALPNHTIRPGHGQVCFLSTAHTKM